MTAAEMPLPLSLLCQFVLAMLATISFAIAFQVPRRHHMACGLVGAVGWIVYVLCNTLLGLSAPVSTLIAVLPLTALARLFSITHRAPVTLFLLSGIFPLVPGAGIYYTAYYFIRNDQRLCTNKGIETIKVAIAIALGIAIVCSIPLPRRLSRQQYRGPNSSDNSPQ